jgi:hypothetical protein
MPGYTFMFPLNPPMINGVCTVFFGEKHCILRADRGRRNTCFIFETAARTHREAG